MKAKIYKETKRFTGEYVGEIGGINETEDTLIVVVLNLPPTEDINKQKFYRWDTHQVQTGTKQVQVMVQDKDELGELLWEDDEETIPKMVQDIDELGNPKFTEEPVIENVTEWIFDEADYNDWLEKENAKTPTLTTEEKIDNLLTQMEDIDSVISELMLQI